MSMHNDAIRRLAFEQLDDDRWRLCDLSVPVADAEHVVAFVERMPRGTYEVTWLIAGPSVQRLSHVEDILREAVTMRHLAERPRGGRATKPMPIPHVPPSGQHPA